MATNSSKEISPSLFSSTYFIMFSIALLSRLPPKPSTSLISSALITPYPSLSNILKAAVSFSFVVSCFSFIAATTNSE